MEAISATFRNSETTRTLHPQTLRWYTSTVGGSQNCLAGISITPDCSSSLKSRQISSELITSSLSVCSDSTFTWRTVRVLMDYWIMVDCFPVIF